MDVLEPFPAQVSQGPEAERDRRMLCRPVERFARGRSEPGERDDVDHVPAPGRPHGPERRQGPVDRSHGVDLEQQPARVGVVIPHVSGHEDSRVVDPDIEGAGALDGHRRGQLARLAVANVEL